ncbi:hypothetical protein ABK040_003618 [Willaertia magna]
MKENNTNNTFCVFEFQNETNNFHSNNKNENLKTNFTEIENVKSICNESADLFYVTTNDKAYQLIEGNFIPRCLNKESSDYGNDIIDVTVNFGEKNILTRDKVYLTSDTVDLPEIDLDDKFVKLSTGASKKFAFLLTEKGKIFIHGENVNGVFGCDVKKLTKFERQTKLDKLENKIVEIKCGYLFAVLRCENGNCYGSGYNCYMNIGTENNSSELREFTLIEQLKGKVKQFDCGYFHTVYLTRNGEIYVTGKFNDGQLGKNFDTTIAHLSCIGLTKLELNGYNKYKSVLCGGYNTFLLTENNNILNCCKQEECTFPVKRKEEYFIEFDCNLDKFIGKFGEREDEIIEMGIQLTYHFMRGIILCKNCSSDLCLLLKDNSMYTLDCNNIYDDSLEFEKVEIIWKYSYLNVYAGDKFIIILNSNFNIEEEESKEKQRMIDLLFKQINIYNPFCDINIIFE